MTREPILRVTRDDLDVQSFRPGGNGGQHRDKTSNAVRIVHRASGATGVASDSRSWSENRKTAFKRMANSVKFRRWLREQLPQDEVIQQPERRYTYKAPHIDMEHRTMQER